mmetsp:Transcript_2530/g.5561  ORF Transcript_2530/g.5561 Transcript_2530/m.5561 type:complete len:1509 (-) Transcript_2530:253-4779(-)
MFDGSHRTNKREINLSGASASSRSSRAVHLNQARQQRLARAQAKAKLNAARLLQRCWRGVRAGGVNNFGSVISSNNSDNGDDASVGFGGCLLDDKDTRSTISRGRKGIAIELDHRFRAFIGNPILLHFENDSPITIEQQHLVSKASSILAFRFSPKLIPFYSANCVASFSISRKNWDSEDEKTEMLMRNDLLKLESLFTRAFEPCNDSNHSKIIIPTTVVKKLTSIIIILLRQSFHIQSNAPTSALMAEDIAEKTEQENLCLVNLMNYLLEAESSYCLETNRLSKYFLNVLGKRSFDGAIVNSGTGISANLTAGDTCNGTSTRNEKSFIGSANEVWMINLFLCFRDCFFLNNGLTSRNSGSHSGTGIDSRIRKITEDMQGLLLKWCCCTILQLAVVETNALATVRWNHISVSPDLLTYQEGLALLASIIFASREITTGSQLWMDVILNNFVSSLKLYLLDASKNTTNGSVDISRPSNSPPNWAPILIHSLSHAISRLEPSEVDFDAQQGFSGGTFKYCTVLGLLKNFYFHSSYGSKTSNTSASKDNTADNKSCQWMKAVRDTMASRECLILNHVIMRARELPKKHQQLHLFLYCIAIILRYTLQNQHGFAVMASFAAQGENIKSWLASKIPSGDVSVELKTKTALAAAYEAEESEDESEDDINETSGQNILSSQARRETASRLDNTTSGRFSRADLQTIPKLDAMYQTHCLLAKNNAIDILNKLLKGDPNKQKYAELMINLAEMIGKGEWMCNLGNSLFSQEQTTKNSTMAPVFLIPIHPLSPTLREHAKLAYFGALSSLLTTSSGVKAGRNAASPLLAKIAFYAPVLKSLCAYSTRQSSFHTFSSSSIDSHFVASDYEVLTAFCDTFSHHLLAVDDDEFLEKYASEVRRSQDQILAKEVVSFVRTVLDDLYWVRPVLAADITMTQHFLQSKIVGFNTESFLRFQKARLILSGTKLWNSLYERWCRLYHVRQYCDEACWIFPHLTSRGQNDNNPIIQSQVTTLADDGDDDALMAESSVESNNSGDRSLVGARYSDENDGGSDALASSFRDPKMARVLTFIPQALPFSRRVNLFQSLLDADKLRTQDETSAFNQMMMNLQHSDGENSDFSGRERVTIHRDSLYDDSMKKLNRLGKKLRKKVQVTFVNQHGTTEAGIDGGGVFKEFLDDLIKDAFLPKSLKNDDGEESQNNGGRVIDFFSVTPLQTLQVNLSTDGNTDVLPHYEFLGRVLGKAIYESILVDPQFCLPFLNKLLGRQNSLDDLKNLDPEYYRNLKSLRYMSIDDINSLGLTFEMTKSIIGTSSSHSSDNIVELIPGGSSIPVTKENVIQYIHLVSHQRMNISGARQTHAFLKGFRDLIPAPWVRLFSAYEFQKLISGDDAVKGIDVMGMAAVMRYSGGFHPSQPIIQWFWEVIDEFTPQQQRKFLKFMTSCSRQPLLGFQSLVPAPCIQQVRLREDDHGNAIVEESAFGNIRLPTSSTCMNLLKLPKYPSKPMLKQKLLYAIESAAGFELS